MSVENARPALTMWSEDEVAFRDAVRSFVEAEIKPHVTHMDEAAQMKPEIVGKLFEMGLMGIESPEKFGGAGINFHDGLYRHRRNRTRRRFSFCSLRCSNTLVTNAVIKYGNDGIKEKYLPKLAKDCGSLLFI